ncbi:MAG: HAMP domain-containing protein [Candidatus Omnitrophica bacterium]|nr:HAMP domain-containing protein [Candidatus Omnitrophota bacterium]
MIKFNSVRFKISVLYTAILGLILVVYSAFLYLSLHYTLYDELDNELNIKASEMAGTISSYLDVLGYSQESFIFAVRRVICLEGENPEQDKIHDLEELWFRMVDKFDLKEDHINFLNSKRQPIVCSGKGLIPFNIKPTQEDKTLFKTIRYEKRNLRLISLPVSFKGGDHYIIQIATSLKPVIHLLQLRLLHIVISIPIILLLASFFGRLFARRILDPVVEITKTASNITHEDLSTRVKAEHVDEEIKYLVDAFNDMISRLEESFKYIAEFSSHVAHELKTPLAIIKGETEVSMRKERNIEEYKRLNKVNLEEVERMLKIINDLLLLTRLDYRHEVLKFKRFDLVELLKDIYEQSKVLASQKDITVTLDISDDQCSINGERSHLRRLFFNLIDNAIKFTSKNGKIDITLKKRDRKTIVSISDTGIGIPDEDISKIFNRFYRVDRIDKNIEYGSGLGLSIVQSIVKMHHGDIHVTSQLNKGSSFIVTIPLSQQ